jgi:pyridoxal kinase
MEVLRRLRQVRCPICADLKSNRRILNTCNSISKINPALVYVCDPVLGDGGKLYVPENLAAVFRDTVTAHATVLTPNQFELELLTGAKIATAGDVAAAMATLHARGVSTVVVTSFSLDAGPQRVALALRSPYYNYC